MDKTNKKKQLPKISSLIALPFSVDVLKNASDAFDQLPSGYIETQKKNRKNPTSAHREKVNKINMKIWLSPEDMYCTDVFHHWSGLINTGQRLNEICLFLRRFPKSTAFEENDIAIGKWTQYHFAYYLVTVTSLYDTAMLLINNVFCLGLGPRDCNNSTVVNNENVVKTPVKMSIDKLFRITNQFREHRNLLVHRGQLPEIERLAQYETLLFIQRAGGKVEDIINPIILDAVYSRARKEFIGELKSLNDKIADLMADLFFDLHPIYIKTKERLQNSQ